MPQPLHPKQAVPIFRLSKTGKVTVLHNFAGGQNGFYPSAGVTQDAAGNLYGTAESGAGDPECSDGCGIVFELSATGRFSVLHTFTGNDGAVLFAGLVRDAKGNLYGTAVNGGSGSCQHGLSNCGVVFKVKP